MIELDDAAIARALVLEHQIDADLMDPAKSLLLSQIASAREAAIDATRALIAADPFKPEEIMRFQNDVRHFRNLIVWLRNAQTKARDVFAQLPPDEQRAVLAFTNPHSEINDA